MTAAPEVEGDDLMTLVEGIYSGERAQEEAIQLGVLRDRHQRDAALDGDLSRALELASQAQAERTRLYQLLRREAGEQLLEQAVMRLVAGVEGLTVELREQLGPFARLSGASARLVEALTDKRILALVLVLFGAGAGILVLEPVKLAIPGLVAPAAEAETLAPE